MSTFSEWIKNDNELFLLAEELASYLFENVNPVELGNAAYWVRQKAILDRAVKYPKEKGNKPDSNNLMAVRKNAPVATKFLRDNLHLVLSQYVDSIYKKANEEQRSEMVNSLYVRVWNWLTNRDKETGEPKPGWSRLPDKTEFANYLYKVAQNELHKIKRQRDRQLAPTSPVLGASGPRVMTTSGFGGMGWSGGKSYRSSKGGIGGMPQRSGVAMKDKEFGSALSSDDPEQALLNKERQQQVYDALKKVSELDAHELNTPKVKKFLQNHGLTPWQAFAAIKQMEFGITPGVKPGEWDNNRGLSDDNIAIKGRQGQFSKDVSEKLRSGKKPMNPNSIRVWQKEKNPVFDLLLQKNLSAYNTTPKLEKPKFTYKNGFLKKNEYYGF